MSKPDNMKSNRAEGCRSNAGVNPSASSLSREFQPKIMAATPMTVEDMMRKAKEAGFTDGETPAAKFILGRVSYQHISEYFPLFDHDSCDVHKTFKSLNCMMMLDRKFQAIIMEYIGLFELQLRSRFSQEMSLRYDAFAHRNPRVFKNQEYFNRYLDEYAAVLKACRKRSQSRAERDIEMYGDMPVWEAFEEMSFGMISRLYSNARNRKMKQRIAGSFGTDSEHLESWLSALTVVRNRCAHFGRLLGERLTIMPKKMDFVDADNSQPLYIVLLLMRLLRSNRSFGDIELLYSVTMAVEVTQLFNKYSQYLKSARIPCNWQELLEDPNVSGIALELFREEDDRNAGIRKGQLPLKEE